MCLATVDEGVRSHLELLHPGRQWAKEYLVRDELDNLHIRPYMPKLEPDTNSIVIP